jgi:hypothetical protein
MRMDAAAAEARRKALADRQAQTVATPNSPMDIDQFVAGEGASTSEAEDKPQDDGAATDEAATVPPPRGGYETRIAPDEHTSPGSGFGPEHPLIQGLFQSLPPIGRGWSAEEAAEWLETAAYSLRLVYRFKGRIRVEAEVSRYYLEQQRQQQAQAELRSEYSHAGPPNRTERR